MIYHKNEDGVWVMTVCIGLKSGRLLQATLAEHVHQKTFTIIQEGPKPNSYVLDSAYFMNHDVVTDGWEKFEIIERPVAFPIKDKPYGMFWLYTFNKPIREPINCKLWRN